MPDELVNVRYMVDDVEAAVAFYTTHFGFTVRSNAAGVRRRVRGNLRLLLSGPTSSAGRPMPDGAQPGPGGWNRIHFVVADIDGRGRAAPRRRPHVPQRHRHRTGRAQTLLDDPSGNPSSCSSRRAPRRSSPAGRRQPAPTLSPRRPPAPRAAAQARSATASVVAATSVAYGLRSRRMPAARPAT